jgi:DNA-binding CsgD family transcriptional regulator
VSHGATRWIPLVEPAGLLGYLYCEATLSLSRAQQRDLDVLGAYASARLVQLGVTVAVDRSPLHVLTPRQREVAELAAAGRSNDEIASALGASVNTIKKHLKVVFAQLGLQSRADLARRLSRSAPDDKLLPGVTRLGNVWVTKAGTRTGHRRSRPVGRAWTASVEGDVSSPSSTQVRRPSVVESGTAATRTSKSAGADACRKK